MIILIFVIALLFSFAIVREMIENQDPYMFCIPRSNDSVKKLLNKIRTCLHVSKFSITWRQNFILTQTIILFLFLCILKRAPTEEELIFCIMGLFGILSVYRLYINDDQSINYINKAISILNKKIK